MTDTYTPSQLEILQRFCDFYRDVPTIITEDYGFFGFPANSLNNQEQADLESLIEKGLVEVRPYKNPNAQRFHRLSDSAESAIIELKEQGRLK